MTRRSKTVAERLADQAREARQKKPTKKPPQPSVNSDGRGPVINNTDLGNARRLIQRHRADLRYVHPWKTWFVWDGSRWAEDQTGEAVRRVKDTQAALFRSATERWQELRDDDSAQAQAERKQIAALLAHLLHWEDARAIGRSLELARSEPGIPLLPADLDREPFLLNVQNGTLDLRTGQLRPHRREDRLSKMAAVEFHQEAACPLWLGCVRRWMDGNEDLVRYLQRVVGYGLTGDVSEQCLWFFHGGGENGKSTFLGTIIAMLGDYAMQAVSDLLMVKHHEAHPTERADLFGKRLVATIETEEGKRMAEALMKQLTGGDPIRARKMRQDFFQFEPTHKIILAANHKPAVRDTGRAAWRRIKLVPFTVTITDAEKDKSLPAKLRCELPGILAWALAGCLDWQEDGLGEPEEVRAATAAYRAEQDTVQAFLDGGCRMHPEAKCQAGALLEAYQRWSGEKLMTAPAFRERLRAKGFENKKGTGGYWYWLGIGLPADEPRGRVGS
jgi:putative DNA primase/helicase